MEIRHYKWVISVSFTLALVLVFVVLLMGQNSPGGLVP